MGNNPVFLMIGNTLIYWHGVIIMLGIVLGIVFACYLRLQQGNRSLNDLFISVLVSIPLAFYVSRSLYCEHFAAAGGQQLTFWELETGGFSLYGAIIGAFAGFVVSTLIQRKNLGQMLDVFAPAVSLAIGIGRLGSIFSGENLGPIVNSEGLHSFPFAVYCETEGYWRSAFFAYQSFLSLALCAVLTLLFFKKYVSHTLLSSCGDLFILFAVVHFATQGCFEMYRSDPLYFNTTIYALWRLRSIQLGMLIGALCSAFALSYFILRIVPRKGLNLRTLLTLIAYAVVCAVAYFCYFNTVIRLEMPDPLPLMLLILGCLGLIAIVGFLFYSQLGTQKNIEMPAAPTNRRAPKPRMPQAAPAARRAPAKNADYFDYWD